ncbi:MAG: CcoQ/FixQ family Cbb3-type cytochrome c oxidase assembly chaperone [Deltaproteobacteria bacterium]|nr:CcoQ/FixQ family Cbb3-type cytochrome c oxidase assembly chaperone [Deltaproteobacteria bacterium]
MTGGGWAYLLFTVALGAVFAGIVVFYFDRRRRDRVEAPKYRMLKDDDE